MLVYDVHFNKMCMGVHTVCTNPRIIISGTGDVSMLHFLATQGNVSRIFSRKSEGKWL